MANGRNEKRKGKDNDEMHENDYEIQQKNA